MEEPAADALMRRMTASGTGVDVKRRSVMVKRNTVGIRPCFIGSDVVDWIMKDLILKTRKEAVDYAEILLKDRRIKNVNKVLKDAPFMDDKLAFYKFPKAAGVKMLARKDSVEDASATMRFFAEMSEGAMKMRQGQTEIPTPSKITVSYVMREVAKGPAPLRSVGMALANIPQDIIVLINRNSGGKAGPTLLSQFQGLLPDNQIIDLIAEGGPQKGLDLWVKQPSLRLLVCGGDGTVGWVLQHIDKTIGTRKDLPTPVIAVVPLGTGNDLSRACGWGSSFSGQSATDLLSTLANSTPKVLDRWKIECFIPERDPLYSSSTEIFHYEMKRGATEVALKEREEAGFGKNTAKAVKLQRDQIKRAESVLNNYFSLGVDAEIVLGFHEMREEHQGLFQGVLVNKGWYAGFSAMAALPRLSKTSRLHKQVALEIDGEPVRIPKNIRGLVVMNLPTYGGGRLWGKGDGKKKTPNEKRRRRLTNSSNGSKGSIDLASEREKERDAAEGGQGAGAAAAAGPDDVNNQIEKEPEKEKEKEKDGGDGGEKMKEKQRRKEKRRADWREKKGKWLEPSVSDGLLEVVGLKGVAHLGAITTGVAHGKKLGQGRSIQITTHAILPVQVDGEPWKMIPCRVTITPHTNQACLLFKNADK